MRRCADEGGCQIGEPAGAVIGAQFKNVINYADWTRPITANGEWSIGSTDTMTNIVDVVTCRYEMQRHRPPESLPFAALQLPPSSSS